MLLTVLVALLRIFDIQVLGPEQDSDFSEEALLLGVQDLSFGPFGVLGEEWVKVVVLFEHLWRDLVTKG